MEDFVIQEFEQMLGTYELVQEGEFNILHLKPSGVLCALTDGYKDSQWFELTGYNTSSHTKLDLGTHDSLDTSEVSVKYVRICCNGETLVRFGKFCKIRNYQEAIVI
jgi:hypothetical protein